MKPILLPALVKKEKIGKTTIQQLLCEEVNFKPNSVQVHSDYLILVSDDGAICISHQRNNIPSNFSKVLICKTKPTVENIYDLSSSLSWIKYPGLSDSYNPSATLATWENVFSFKEENLEKEIWGLRRPQIAAVFSVLSHWRVGDDIGTVVMPTGTGKTETMLSLLIAHQCSKLLVIVPTDPLREQITSKFVTLGHLQKPKFGIVASSALKPIVGTLCENFKSVEDLESFVDSCNVVITTMALISAGSMEFQQALARKVSNIFIDEAHHTKAPTWGNFKNLCEKEKLLQFTATPFRNDGESLDGKIIFNYSLSKAQEDGYFKKISLIQVNEWDNELSDKAIVDAAIEQLKKDREQHDHILMARCSSVPRANEVYELYKVYTEFNPVVIHTGLNQKERKESKSKILNKEAKIIVCVDMLGEGFDLPNLKIAAFHDIRKSLPITVQLAGRFTRTKFDEQLGNASIVVNLKDSNVTKELDEFYALGADWNTILPRVSTTRINREVDFAEFLDGFSEVDKSKIPFQSLSPALSTVVYKNNTDDWFPKNFKSGIHNVDDLDYLFHDINRSKKTLVIITGKKDSLDWGQSKDIYNILWSLYIIHWDTKNNLLFINASDNAGLYRELATAIIGEEAEIINKIDVFRAFHNIEQMRLQNVGLKEFLGRNKSFSMHTGFDIEQALDLAEKENAEKAFVAGTGYEDGNKVSIGCSYKGRIWTHRKGDIQELIDWCLKLGEKLVDKSINPNTVLKETLIPNSVSQRPSVSPFIVDWDEEVFLQHETRIVFIINGMETCFYNAELCIVDPSENGELLFDLVTPNEKITYRQVLFNTGKYDDYKFEKVSTITDAPFVKIGSRSPVSFEIFLSENPVMWRFVDGSSLSGNKYVQLKRTAPSYLKENIMGWNWSGVSLSKESQKIDPKQIDSIQYKVIQDLKAGDFDIIYDDDYSGEIADVITIKRDADVIRIQLFHLKFAKEGRVSQRVDDLYEVCGQAVKSANWKFKESREFFEHLLRRETKKRKGKSCSRIEVGSKDIITQLRDIARKKYPVEFEVFIVQPSLSCTNPSPEQLILLGVAESYLKGRANIPLNVIGHE